MFSLDSHTLEEIKKSSRECSDRGLSVASKWASELYLSVPMSRRGPGNRLTLSTSAFMSTPAPPRSSIVFDESFQEGTETGHISMELPLNTPARSTFSNYSAQGGVDFDHDEEDILVAARARMESREFKRVSSLLNGCRSPKARFLDIYNQFLMSEKCAQREWHRLDNNRHQPPIPVNSSLNELLELVVNATDPWLIFLKALFLSRLSRREEAIECCLLSIAKYPWNWSAWTLLGSCVEDGEELSSICQLIPLSQDHPLVLMFQIRTLNELHSPSDHELELCDRLLGQDHFPNSLWVMGLRACVLYHLHDFSQAESQFDRILALDPYRIDDVDVLSNILFVTDNRLKLSKLAHEFLALDKDRPEVCCLVGNHYSLRAEHEKAIKYFRRATQLDRTYLAAWTLMGHEYIEMKNSHAAIESYRRAVDVNRKDYRAWYGLGQAYELLSMHHYALHYYQRATALRPYDVRLWQAQGICYEEIGRPREAVECLKHALIPADPREITIILKLAKLYSTLEEPAEAVAYHQRVVEVCQADLRPIQDYAKSCLQVAEYHMKIPGGDLYLARDYLERVAASNAEDVLRASEMLKIVKSTIQAKELADAVTAAPRRDSVDMEAGVTQSAE